MCCFSFLYCGAITVEYKFCPPVPGEREFAGDSFVAFM